MECKTVAGTVSAAETAHGGCAVIGRLTIFSGVVWWYLSFVGGGTIITIAGCAALATASDGLSGGHGGGVVLLVGVCFCLLLFIQDILVG